MDTTSFSVKKVMAMFLYQVTEWMEERMSLRKALMSGIDDPSQLQFRIDQLDAQLYSQAERWKNSFPSLEIPHLEDEIRF
jgi:hypothetical protein